MDFLASYGIAIIILIISVSVIYKISIAGTYISATYCTPNAGFSCEFSRINATGILNITLSQSTGGVVLVKGIACSVAVNATNDTPAYGNFRVTNSIGFYPAGSSPGTGVTIPIDGAKKFYIYCYNQGGIASTNQLGNTFVGYVWLNYTISGTNVNLVQRAASIQLTYT